MAASGDYSPINQSTTVINGAININGGHGGAAAPDHHGWKKTLSVSVSAGSLLALIVILVGTRMMPPSQSFLPDEGKTRSARNQDIGTGPLPQPQPQPLPPAQIPGELTVSFDRDTPIYHHGERQALTVQVPEAGYLYVISVWAENEKAFLLYHPTWNKGLVWEKPSSGGSQSWRMDYTRYGLDNAPPQTIARGSTLRLLDTKIEFPEILAPGVREATANVLVILSHRPLESIPGDYKADVAPILKSLGLLPPVEGAPSRNGSPPEILPNESGSIAHTQLAPYSVLKH